MESVPNCSSTTTNNISITLIGTLVTKTHEFFAPSKITATTNILSQILHIKQSE